jgi:hypothetical protein
MSSIDHPFYTPLQEEELGPVFETVCALSLAGSISKVAEEWSHRGGDVEHN